MIGVFRWIDFIDSRAYIISARTGCGERGGCRFRLCLCFDYVNGSGLPRSADRNGECRTEGCRSARLFTDSILSVCCRGRNNAGTCSVNILSKPVTSIGAEDIPSFDDPRGRILLDVGR